jgi:hypothetical protein
MTALLITTAVSPPEGVQFLKLNSHVDRLVATKAAIYFWMLSGIHNIVIADATDTIILNDEDLKFAQSLNLNIEQLKYNQNINDILIRGKGYGEAKLLEYTFQESFILKSSLNFFKCTGKLFINNFDQILNLINSHNFNSLFWRWGDGIYNFTHDYVDTRFYYSNINFYFDNILPLLLQTDERTSNNHERQAFKAVNQTHKNGPHLRPVIVGYGGGGGQLHQHLNLGILESSFPSWYL